VTLFYSPVTRYRMCLPQHRIRNRFRKRLNLKIATYDKIRRKLSERGEFYERALFLIGIYMFTSGQVINPRTVFVMFLSQLRKRNLLSSAEFEFTVTRLWSSILQITLICNQGAIHRFLGYPVLLRYVYTLRCMSRILALIKITADATQFLFDFVQFTAKSVKCNYISDACLFDYIRQITTCSRQIAACKRTFCHNYQLTCFLVKNETCAVLIRISRIRHN
jgi:hypothetical protein